MTRFKFKINNCIYILSFIKSNNYKFITLYKEGIDLSIYFLASRIINHNLILWNNVTEPISLNVRSVCDRYIKNIIFS